MSIAKKIKERLEEKQKFETTSTSTLIERLKKQKESEKQESIKSNEFKYESGLYGFDSGLMKKYQKEFKGKKLEKYFEGEIIKNSFGNCYSIINEVEIKIKFSLPEKTKQKYFSELRIIDGIGEFYEKKLINEGYKSLDDLSNHYRFGTITKKFQDLINTQNGFELLKWLERRYPKSHQLVFLVSSFYNQEDFIFIDIETLGLLGHPLFLIGIAYFDKQTLIIEQILARDMDEEATVLAYLKDKLKKKRVIGSFNGKSFDIPVIKNRMAYYSIKENFNLLHFDSFHFSKRAFKDQVINFQLTTLENSLFDVKRKDHVPSFLVPCYYTAYLKTKNIGSLVPIIEHNKQDIISTVKIFGLLHELWG